MNEDAAGQESTEDDDVQLLQLKVTVSLDALQQALIDHYLRYDDGGVDTPRYDPVTRSITFDVDLALEPGMTTGHRGEHYGLVSIDVPMSVDEREQPATG